MTLSARSTGESHCATTESTRSGRQIYGTSILVVGSATLEGNGAARCEAGSTARYCCVATRARVGRSGEHLDGTASSISCRGRSRKQGGVATLGNGSGTDGHANGAAGPS